MNDFFIVNDSDLDELMPRDKVYVSMSGGYTGIVEQILNDSKNKKTFLILSSVPPGKPCRVDITDCILVERIR
mgnify:CR=1 FL=1